MLRTIWKIGLLFYLFLSFAVLIQTGKTWREDDLGPMTGHGDYRPFRTYNSSVERALELLGHSEQDKVI